MSFSTSCLTSKYCCGWIFNIARHPIFYSNAGLVYELMENEKCLKMILKRVKKGIIMHLGCTLCHGTPYVFNYTPNSFKKCFSTNPQFVMEPTFLNTI